jgi:hypothetical protein
MTDINQLGLVRTNHCPNCEAQAAGVSRFTKAEEDALRNHVKFVSGRHVQITHENVALQTENEKLREALRSLIDYYAPVGDRGYLWPEARAALEEKK